MPAQPASLPRGARYAETEKMIGLEVPENERGFSFAALSGSAARAVGRPELGCFAARGPFCPAAGRAAGGPGLFIRRRMRQFFWASFSFRRRGAAALNGRSLLFDGAWPVRGRSSQLCLAGPPWAEHGRGLPVFLQPHVCSLFYLLSWHGAAGRSTFLAGAVLALQISARWLVPAEERWCEEAFGEEY